MIEAKKLKAQGQLEQAVGLCLKALSEDSNNDEAHFVLGSIKLEQGHTSEAYEALHKAVEIRALPKERIVLFTSACIKLGKLEEAQRYLRSAIKLSGQSVALQVHLSTVSLLAKRPEDALTAAFSAYELEPRNYQVLICIGSAFMALHKPIDARNYFERALELRSDSAIAMINLAQVALVENRFEDALSFIDRAKTSRVLDETGLITRWRALVFLGRGDEAIRQHQALDQGIDAFVRLTLELIQALVSFGDANLAMSVADSAVKSRPTNTRLLRQRATILMSLGKYQAAQKDLENALELDPGNLDIVFMLAGFVKHHEGSKITKQVENASRRNDLTTAEKSAIGFVMSSVQRKLSNRESAIAHLHEGNKNRQLSLQYSIDDDVAFFADIRRKYEQVSQDQNLDQPLQESRRSPIFIVGMPRSGTTLVEQILSAHSYVHGAGELPCLGQIMDQYIFSVDHGAQSESLPRIELGHMANQYYRYIQHMGEQERYVVDKQPLNFRFVGFAKLMFPNAKIVHMNRDPRAVCWSIYKQSFAGRGNGYAYGLDTVAQFYQLYLDLMEYWRSQASDMIFDLSYERLVSHPEEVTKEVVAFCDLPWQKECLNIEQNHRPVKTASMRQVRNPIYSGSSDAWKKYEPFLGEMISHLKSWKVPFPE